MRIQPDPDPDSDPDPKHWLKGYNLIGVTTEKETQREVRQHWFIYSYISAYIQALYMYYVELLEYIRLVWPSTRDVSRCPQSCVNSVINFHQRIFKQCVSWFHSNYLWNKRIRERRPGKIRKGGPGGQVNLREPQSQLWEEGSEWEHWNNWEDQGELCGTDSTLRQISRWAAVLPLNQH
jgi:hypothetical protein